MAKRDRSINSSVIEKRIAEGRGKGTGGSYNPWLHVQDVPTTGRCAGYLEYPFQNRASIGAFVISVLQQLLEK